MTDMSPINTLRNWGISSKELLRRKAPIRVTRGSFLVACRVSAYSLGSIDLNFKQLNTSLFLPFLFWTKNIEPPDSNLIKIPTKGISQERMNRVTRLANTKSKALLAK